MNYEAGVNKKPGKGKVLGEKSTWNLLVGNINSFPNEIDGQNKYKLDKLKELVIRGQTDILLISEHNRNIQNMQRKSQPSEILRKWWKNTIARASYLMTDGSKSIFEPGGTMIVTHSRATAHTCTSEQDTQYLGRWNSITLKGKRDHYTTIISIYRPTRYQETYNRQTAYTAKRRKTLSDEASPESLWFCDLQDFIKEKINLGHEVVVAGDFNDDLNDLNGKTRTFMTNLGLREIMIERYGSGPATHIRGTKTIDGVFATAGICMVKGRYIPFVKSPGDHRWIELQITEASLLGIARDNLCPPMVRRTTSKIPSVKNSFQQLLEEQVMRYKLHQKMQTLYQRIIDGRPFNKDQEQEYETIERRMQRAVKYADSNCRKIRRGKIPFSPIQKQLMGAITILHQLKLRLLLKGKPNCPKTKRIKRLIQKYKYNGQTQFQNVHELDKAISKATSAYNSFKGESIKLRWLYLEQIAAEYDEIDKKGVQHHYNILYQREMTKDYFRRIRYCEGKNKGGGVDCVQMESDNGPVIVYDKSQIEQEIMRVNKEKLLQANDTPLRSEGLSTLLGEQGDFDRWEEILSGILQLPTDVDEGLRMWYTYITSVERHTPMDFMWSTEEYIASWSKMKEEKMTLPGIQVAHIKSLEPTSRAAEIISRLALIPLMVGYSPKTWRVGIDSMIPKKIADLRPEKLRLILLLDARFNHNNKLIGKKMMEYGEKYSLLAPEQFGSRKNKSAIDHATNKRLVLDNVRQSGRNAIYIANDAKSCYDRILLMVAYLTMRNFGVPSLVAKSTISTILHMRHHVRTKYGDSSTYYGGDKWNTKPHGCGQGNGYGPALWACISSPLLHLMREKGYGTKLQCPISEIIVHIAAFAFVDDVDIIQTSEHQGYENSEQLLQDIDELLMMTQMAINQWSSTLRATGGALEPNKTFCVPIISKWQGSHKTVQKIAQEGTIHLKNQNGNHTTLKQQDPNSAFFTLGIWQSPSGDETRQKEHLINIIKEWDKKTNQNKLTWSQARIAVQSTIGRTLHYPLTATAFDGRQCATIQRVFNKAVLGKMGIVRTTPSIIATAPPSLGGLGVLSFEIQQLISHLNLIILHGPDTSSMTHQLLRVTMETYALETGIPGDPAKLPGVSYTTRNCWITQTLHEMKQYNISLSSDFDGLSSWCHDDIVIMDRMRKLYSGNTLAIINKVRMYLRVVTWSDLVSADGSHYDENLLWGIQGYDHPSPSKFRYRWPVIPTPKKSERELWNHSLRLAFEISITPGRNTPLRRPVWNKEAVQYAKWRFDPIAKVVYEKNGHARWQKWIKTQSSGRLTRASANQYTRGGLAVEIPEESEIISIKQRDNSVFIRGQAGRCEINRQNLNLAAQHENQNGRNHHLIGYYLYNIQLHTGIIISDGSYAKDVMTFAYISQPIHHNTSLTNIDLDTLLYGSGHVTGDRLDSSSYRAELAGILAAIIFTNDLCSQYKITQGTCTIYCDNKGALSAAFGYKRPTPRWTSYDLVRQLRKAIKSAPITWKYKHVKGHQDDTVTFAQLDSVSQGNVIVDHLAAVQRDKTPQTSNSVQQPWVPVVNGRTISGNLDARLMEDIYRPAMKERWGKILGINPTQYTLVDWNLFFHCLSTQKKSEQTFWTKFNARLLPVGKNLKRRRHSESESCPCCGLDEDHDHIIQCKHPEMEQRFIKSVVDISTILTDGTNEIISGYVLDLLEYFRIPQDGHDNVEDNSDLMRLHKALGPRSFFAGLWSTQWFTLQEQYFNSARLQRSTTLWLSKLIHRIQRVPLDMWHTRNHILHRNNENFTKKQTANELDLLIDDLYARKPHSRLLAHCDNVYFNKHGKDRVKKMTLRRKINWIAGANLIMAKYDRVTTTQAKRFTSYFQWDRG